MLYYSKTTNSLTFLVQYISTTKSLPSLITEKQITSTVTFCLFTESPLLLIDLAYFMFQKAVLPFHRGINKTKQNCFWSRVHLQENISITEHRKLIKRYVNVPKQVKGLISIIAY